MKLTRWCSIGVIFSFTVVLCCGFDKGGYCLRACRSGHGGNLCKCSAVHFAGKREQNLQSYLNDNPSRGRLDESLEKLEMPFSDSQPQRTASASDFSMENLERPGSDSSPADFGRDAPHHPADDLTGSGETFRGLDINKINSRRLLPVVWRALQRRYLARQYAYEARAHQLDDHEGHAGLDEA